MPSNKPAWYPERGTVYTLREMIEELTLRDSPFLRFWFAPPANLSGEEVLNVIQHSHCTNEQLLNIEGFADTLWMFQYETDEWIPLFTFAGDTKELLSFVDMEPCADALGNWWVTPKTLPRLQYEVEFQGAEVPPMAGFSYASFDWKTPTGGIIEDEWKFAFVWNGGLYVVRNKPTLETNPRTQNTEWNIPEAVEESDVRLIAFLRSDDPMLVNWQNTLVGRGPNNEVIKLVAEVK